MIMVNFLLFGMIPVFGKITHPNPEVPTTFFVKSDLKTLEQTCQKDDPCKFFAAWSAASNGDTLIFQQGNYTMEDMGYSTTPAELVSNDGKVLYLYGGWDGEPTLGIEPIIDPSSYPTILNGEGIYRIVTITGSYNPSLIDGFTMINGYAENADNTYCVSMGGGVDPACGGAIYVAYASPTIRHNTIHDNIALNQEDSLGLGGGIYAYSSLGIKILNNVIYSNSGSTLFQGKGGGIYLYHAGTYSEITGNIISSNRAATSPQIGMGAGVALEDCDSVLISSNLFALNNPDGIPTLSGSALYSTGSTFDLLDNFLINNYWQSVVFLYNSKANIERNRFHNTDATYGLEIYRGSATGYSYVFNNFFAEHNNAHIYVWGSAAEYANLYASNNTILNTSVSNNRGYVIGNYVTGAFLNNIIVNQKDGFYGSSHSEGSITIDYNLMYGNTHDYDIFAFGHAFTGDPLFVNMSGGNYHIQPNSPAINKSPGFVFVTDDYDRQPRPSSSSYDLVDLGADEIVYSVFFPLVRK